MAISWKCVGKSEHGYQYKDATGTLQNAKVIAVDYMAEIDGEDASGAVNELFDAKPVLTEAGVEAFVGLQVYPQGFTVYLDTRLTNLNADEVIGFGDDYANAEDFEYASVGGYISFDAGGSE